MNKTLIASALVLSSLSGCASITKGTSQTLVFNLEPIETRCNLTRDGDGDIGSINGKNNSVTVSKDKDDILVKCMAPGYRQQITRLTSSAETAGVVGGIFLDLGITDMITGAMWSYPNTTSISLEPNNSSSVTGQSQSKQAIAIESTAQTQ